MKKRIAEGYELDKILRVFVLMNDDQKDVLYQIVLILKKNEDMMRNLVCIDGLRASHINIEELKNKN